MKINLKDGRYINVTIEKNEQGVYEYYTDGILIGVYAPNSMKDSKFLKIDLEKNNSIKNELSAEIKDDINQILDQVRDEIDNTDTKKIEEEANENKAISEYMREIGMNPKKGKRVKSIEINKEKDVKDTKEKQEQKETGHSDQQPNIVTTSDVNVKQEINLGERATDVENFGKWLGNKVPKDVKKVGVIESDDLSKMKDENGNVIDNSSTRYGLVVIRRGENGKNIVEPLKKYIPELEQNHSSGNNPMKSQYQIDTNGEVEKDPVLSEYRIGNKIIQLDKDHGDDLEVNIGKYSPSGNNLVTTQMRDKNTTYATDTQARKAAMGHYKGVYNSEESYKEAKMHEVDGKECGEMTSQDIDGDETTKSHEHIQDNSQILDEYASKILENDKIASIYNREDVKKHILEKANEELTSEELLEQVEGEMEESAESEHDMPSPSRRD